jgi:ABC-type glycerol-3-phosphate transport system permease component
VRGEGRGTPRPGMVAWSWPRPSAVYVLVILPGLLAFAIAQRWYVKGLQAGALKW